MSTVLQILQKHRREFRPVVEYDQMRDKILRIDLSKTFIKQNQPEIKDMGSLAEYINSELEKTGSTYAIGGYNEERNLYSNSKLFDGAEPRSIHLGIDIWGKAGTKIYAPLGGVIHSFANNEGEGNYGPTIILQHQLETKVFHTLYGHLALADIAGLMEGKYISRGELIGHFGISAENGNWPPHLHFQVIEDMRLMEGDYPGVCSPAERDAYLKNCPDPESLLNMEIPG